MGAYSKFKHFFIISCHRQTYQDFQIPLQSQYIKCYLCTGFTEVVQNQDLINQINLTMAYGEEMLISTVSIHGFMCYLSDQKILKVIYLKRNFSIQILDNKPYNNWKVLSFVVGW